MSKVKQLDPLREFLDAVVTRIEALETHCGISGSSSVVSSQKSQAGSLQKLPSTKHISGSAETPGIKGYDKYMYGAVYELSNTCDDLEMGDLGKLITKTFEGIRHVLVLSSRAKLPEGDIASVLSPHLEQTNQANKEITGLRLDRKFDNHMKAIKEMLPCLSWVFCRAPKQLPAPFVKDCIGSSDFWSNRIRKEYKGKNEPLQLAFCDNLKKVMTGLAVYIEEYHKTGLTFNPKGVSLAEAAIVLTDNPMKDAATVAVKKERRPSSLGNTVKAGNILGLMSELSGRKTADGASAATGLKHVTKDQQTWRKEFKGGAPPPKPAAPKPPVKKTTKKKKAGLPIMEYQERGTKWIIENQTKETALKEAPNGVLTIEITDPKQQVYIFNCDEISVQIKGPKLKSVILDTCFKVNVVFETIISGCEMVNSKRVAIQADGVCPVFTIDKTIGATVWLSEASKQVSTFTTSMSSEMNVNIPDGDDRKEMPIPEQFVHKISGGNVSSEVSDLYH